MVYQAFKAFEGCCTPLDMGKTAVPETYEALSSLITDPSKYEEPPAADLLPAPAAELKFPPVESGDKTCESTLKNKAHCEGLYNIVAGISGIVILFSCAQVLVNSPISSPSQPGYFTDPVSFAADLEGIIMLLIAQTIASKNLPKTVSCCSASEEKTAILLNFHPLNQSQ